MGVYRGEVKMQGYDKVTHPKEPPILLALATDEQIRLELKRRRFVGFLIYLEPGQSLKDVDDVRMVKVSND